MIKQDVLTMKPGRDLDIKVATKIMGYIWLTFRLRFSAEMVVKWLDTPEQLVMMNKVYTPAEQSGFDDLKLRENYAEAVPCYSTDPAAARQVAEKLAADGYPYSLTEEEKEGKAYFMASFSRGEQQWEATAASAAEAIVKAALLSVEN